jgi:hypothetical protein
MATPLDVAASVATIGSFAHQSLPALQALALPLMFKTKIKKNRNLLLAIRAILDFCCNELYTNRLIMEAEQRDSLSEEYEK